MGGQEGSEEARMWQITSEQRNKIAELKAEMQEIHHRVKNDFQTVASMLNMQARETKDDVVKVALQEARDRVNLMAHIYEQLQRSSDSGQVSIQELATSIVSQYGFARKGVSASVFTPNGMILDSERARNCGLMLNEFLSNVFKHAFPDHKKGEVQVDFLVGRDDISLIVRDNGVGFPKDFDLKDTESLGIGIVKLLAEQMDGRVSISRRSDRKTVCSVMFPIQVSRK